MSFVSYGSRVTYLRIYNSMKSLFTSRVLIFWWISFFSRSSVVQYESWSILRVSTLPLNDWMSALALSFFSSSILLFETFVLQFAVQKCLYLGGFWSDFEFLKTHMSPHVSCHVLGMSWTYPGHVQVMSEAPSNSLLMHFFQFISIFFFQFFSISLLKINFFT